MIGPCKTCACWKPTQPKQAATRNPTSEEAAQAVADAITANGGKPLEPGALSGLAVASEQLEATEKLGVCREGPPLGPFGQPVTTESTECSRHIEAGQ